MSKIRGNAAQHANYWPPYRALPVSHLTLGQEGIDLRDAAYDKQPTGDSLRDKNSGTRPVMAPLTVVELRAVQTSFRILHGHCLGQAFQLETGRQRHTSRSACVQVCGLEDVGHGDDASGAISASAVFCSALLCCVVNSC
ncbi:unnamed protein product [[Candida] boidinii]|uniref:Unnamed protein product n=1 Tax=Candida boidinii TaxID=5477 RepID=A0A9W6W718_CANBO|nr:unnamed protein product [[Candida] boidinii]GMF56507.1 unnamed protein product [[Candida] boidinii]GMG06761.1 unnamed protein product [[Candida] boidinii]